MSEDLRAIIEDAFPYDKNDCIELGQMRMKHILLGLCDEIDEVKKAIEEHQHKVVHELPGLPMKVKKNGRVVGA